jgi:hypothetical protein
MTEKRVLRLATMWYLSVAEIALMATPVQAQQSPPPVGVYECFGRYGPAFPVMFGIVDHNTYETFDAARGEYSFNTSNGMIAMVTGPMTGMRYARVNPSGDPWTENGWRYMDEKGELTAYFCPHVDKDPTKHPW